MIFIGIISSIAAIGVLCWLLFTLAVVALPFVRTPLVPAAIAIGAMTPDLPLFLRGTPLTYQATHTNVLLSTVIALGLLALWYAVLRPAVRELSPDSLARRLPAEWDGPPAFGRTGGGARTRSRLVVALQQSHRVVALDRDGTTRGSAPIPSPACILPAQG